VDCRVRPGSVVTKVGLCQGSIFSLSDERDLLYRGLQTMAAKSGTFWFTGTASGTALHTFLNSVASGSNIFSIGFAALCWGLRKKLRSDWDTDYELQHQGRG
jgi:hypothetical protein